MRVSSPRFLVFTVLLSLLSLRNAVAQTTTSGALTGSVRDASSAVIVASVVVIRDTAKGMDRFTTTDGNGEYAFYFLLPSRYTLTVAHQGFRTQSREVIVSLGPAVSVNILLEIASATVSTTVTGQAPRVQADNGDSSTTLSRQQISELPNPGNDLTYIAQSAPGVVMNTDVQGYANFSVLGMPGTSNLFTIDGTNNNDNATNFNLSGALGLFLGQNQIQEATVVSAGYSGQFGGAAGANINYVTKSGSDELHGNAQYYWNGTALNANSWFRNVFQAPRALDVANQWAGSLGGPIKSDKLFYFVNSEGVRLVIPQSSPVIIPSPEFQAATIANLKADARFGPASPTVAFYNEIFSLYNAAPRAGATTSLGSTPECSSLPGLSSATCAVTFLSSRSRPSADTLTSGRLDWNLSAKDRAFLRLQNDHGLGAFYTDTISPLFDADHTMSWWQGSLNETHAFGSSGASQFLVAASYFSAIFRSKGSSSNLSTFPNLNFDVTGAFTSLGGDNGIGASGRNNTQYQVSEDLVKIRGRHTFAAGANFQQSWWSVLPNRVNVNGSLSPQTLDAFFYGGFDPANPATNYTKLTQAFTKQGAVRVSFFDLGAYGEDRWRARPGLTLTMGLRVEHYSNPTCRDGCFTRLADPFNFVPYDPSQPYRQGFLLDQTHAVSNSDKLLWSPRFSFAWQLLGGAHNMVLRGGVGVFYDGFIRAIAEPFYINAPVYNVFTTFGNNLAPDETNSLFTDARMSNEAFLSGFFAGDTLADIQQSVPNFSPPAFNAAARTIHSPQFQRWSLELEQAFGTHTSVSMGYFGHHGIHEMVFNGSANAFCDPDQISLPSGEPNPCFGFRSTLPRSVPDPRFSNVTETTTNAVSNYNGAVVSFKHQFTRWNGGLIQASYTYGHAFDEVSNGGIFSFTSGSSLSPQDPHNLRGSYGPAEYDVRHSFNANYVWELPLKSALGGRGSDILLRGWQISGTLLVRTGFPYTVLDPVISGNLAENNYAGMVYAVPARPLGANPSCGAGAAFPLAPRPCQPAQSNPNANFVQAGCETGFNRGTLPGQNGACGGREVFFAQGRNHFRGPGYFNTDFALMKRTRIPHREKLEVGLGLQFFNLFNHPNFGFPDNLVSSQTLGQIFYLEQSPTTILGNFLGGDATPRMIQLKAEVRF